MKPHEDWETHRANWASNENISNMMWFKDQKVYSSFDEDRDRKYHKVFSLNELADPFSDKDSVFSFNEEDSNSSDNTRTISRINEQHIPSDESEPNDSLLKHA